MTKVLVLGTNNLKKREELEKLLLDTEIQIKTLRDFENSIEVVEDGLTFAENADKKASQQAIQLNQWVLAEDSGLIVDSLKDEPGVYSARYAALKKIQLENGYATLADAARLHPDIHSSDPDNNAMLLEVLDGKSGDQRRAHYCCFMALSNPQGEIVARTSGVCYGRILTEPYGENGFGYDPYFEVVEFHKTFGLLAPEVKSCISHRARATRAMIPLLKALERQA